MDFESFAGETLLSPGLKQHFEAHQAEWLTGWDGTVPDFMRKPFFEELYPFCHGPALEGWYARVLEVRRILEQNPGARALAWMIWRGALVLKKDDFAWLPETLPLFGENTGVFYLMLSLAAAPLIEKAYAGKNVPECYAKAILRSISGSMAQFARAHNGDPGVPVIFDWLQLVLAAKMFRVGRLEYMIHPYPEWVPALYRDRMGRLAILCRNGWRFDANGRRVRDNEEAVFISRLQIDSDAVSGVPVDRLGRPIKDRILTLKRCDWSPVASPWDVVPSMHIPGGERMPFEEVKYSILSAKAFFKTCFQADIPLVCCHSWLLNWSLEKHLQNSNIVRFRQEGCAVPAPSWGRIPGMRFLFGRDDVVPTAIPATNRAEAAYQELYRENQLGVGAIIMLAEDFEKLGSMPYRNREEIPC